MRMCAKKPVSLVLILTLLLALFTGCGSNGSTGNGNTESGHASGIASGDASTNASSDDSVTIVTTIFPIYDWIREIGRERIGEGKISVSYLAKDGTDIHSYQPSVDDMISICECDLFIYVGGDSDQWVEDALAATEMPGHNDERQVISLLEIMEEETDLVLEEEEIEGLMEDHHGHAEEEEEADEHVWLSLRNALYLTTIIRDELILMDPDGEEIYEANCETYAKSLTQLDEAFTKKLKKAGELPSLLFADRFPFRYMTYDYDLTYYAAFSGCSAESEASFDTVTFLSEKMKSEGIDRVLILDGNDGRIARTIFDAAEKEGEILILNTMQAVSDEEKNTMSYLGVMEENLKVLSAALNLN